MKSWLVLCGACGKLGRVQWEPLHATGGAVLCPHCGSQHADRMLFSEPFELLQQLDAVSKELVYQMGGGELWCDQFRQGQPESGADCEGDGCYICEHCTQLVCKDPP